MIADSLMLFTKNKMMHQKFKYETEILDFLINDIENVEDVEKFPGHIACSSASRSEIVVPVIRNGEVIAVLDIDSEHLNTFDSIDKEWLEKVAEIVPNPFSAY